MTQNSALLAALKKRKMTAYQCLMDLGIACPTKRISELRRKGFDIVTIPKQVKTRYGKTMIAVWELKP